MKPYDYCSNCKQNQRHDLIYERKVGKIIRNEEYKCTVCGHKTMVEYKKKERLK